MNLSRIHDIEPVIRSESAVQGAHG